MPNPRLNPDELVELLAKKTSVAPAQIRAVLQAQAEIVCEYGAEDSPIPGVGVLKHIDRPARKMMMRFGPNAGQVIAIPASKKVRFFVCPMAKDIILARKPPTTPDIFDPANFEIAWYQPDVEYDD
jgi:nucleoid DNA-binding protein